VMELIEGETLSQRLSRGPMAPAEVLRIAADIAGALAAAHRRGIIHRDLKPANVMLTPDGVKLLDFGLAKPSGPADNDKTRLDLTGEGMVVGTLYYMAPEQLEGKQVDARGDLFAFGALLYEMLSGHKAFDGDSQASIIAAILSGPRPMVPNLASLDMPVLEHLIGSCLERDPDLRRHSARDLELDLRWLASNRPASAPASEPVKRSNRWKTAAMLIAPLALGGWPAFWLAPVSNPPEMLTYSIDAPTHAEIVPRSPLMGGSAISPDGQTLAFVASSGGRARVWTRRIDTLETKMIPGTEGAYSPFWSPDSKSIGYFALGQLRRVDLDGGGARTIAPVPAGDGGSWSAKGVILFSRAATGGLFKVAADGGTPEPVTTPDASRREFLHTWAEFLPDGVHFVFTALSADADNCRILAGSLDPSQKPAPIANMRSRVRYIPGGKRFGFLDSAGALLYTRDQTLVAQAFDPASAKLSGEPVAVPGAFATQDFSTSATGTVVLGTANGADMQLVWRDREGKDLGSAGDPGPDHYPNLASGGRLLATARPSAETNSTDIWVTDLDRNARTRLTFEPGMDAFPVWSSDGKSVLFSSSREGTFRLHHQVADGVDQAHPLAPGSTHQIAWDWSPTAAHVLFSELNPNGRWTMQARPMPNGDAISFTNPEFNSVHGQFSPDGRFVAFTSDQTGRDEVYLQTFSVSRGAARERWPVSTRGGCCARWRADGKELFFIGADEELVAVPVSLSGPKPSVGAPQKLFRLAPPAGNLAIPYDVSTFGTPSAGHRDDRFLVVTPTPDATEARYTVIRGWRR
ncbi:MAG: protein kinase, partial [Bryobacteraceae bacterium]